jgi:hypothetical protein
VYYREKENYERKRCGYRQRLTVDTVLQSNPLPFRYWFIAAEVVASDEGLSPNEVSQMLRWVRIYICNVKRMLPDLFHDIKLEYLQNYLNKFCCKFNRRCFIMLMAVVVMYKRTG